MGHRRERGHTLSLRLIGIAFVHERLRTHPPPVSIQLVVALGLDHVRRCALFDWRLHALGRPADFARGNRNLPRGLWQTFLSETSRGGIRLHCHWIPRQAGGPGDRCLWTYPLVLFASAVENCPAQPSRSALLPTELGQRGRAAVSRTSIRASWRTMVPPPPFGLLAFTTKWHVERLQRANSARLEEMATISLWGCEYKRGLPG